MTQASWKRQSNPLGVDEVLELIRSRWTFTYELKLVVRSSRIYLQMMWGYLEQQSFKLDEEEYRTNLYEIVEIINRLGQAEIVREWLLSNKLRPKVGRAISLPLKPDDRFKEFLI